MRKFFNLLVILISTSVVSQATTTLISNVDVGSLTYDIRYNTDADSFADLETGGTNFSNLAWWGVEQTAKDFANATGIPAGLRFAFSESEFSGAATVLYHDSTTTSGVAGQQFQTANATYAISAVEVPAPLPILGILPVVGFLKRMRKRQRA